jgi:hypothetical protein
MGKGGMWNSLKIGERIKREREKERDVIEGCDRGM